LGTPHLGAPLERAANAGGWALGGLAETRPFAKVVNGRSVGIKDLRFGNCVEEDWCDCEPDEFLRDRCKEVPFLPTATYYFIGAPGSSATASHAVAGSPQGFRDGLSARLDLGVEMAQQRVELGRDAGLRARMLFVLFVLGLLYVALVGVLFAAGASGVTIILV